MEINHQSNRLYMKKRRIINLFKLMWWEVRRGSRKSKKRAISGEFKGAMNINKMFFPMGPIKKKYYAIL